MYNGLRKIIQEVLLENKLFNKSQVDQIQNKFKDSSEELKNQLAIFGLFRQQAPFNQIQDISQLQSKEQLTNLFNQWMNSMIQGMMKTKSFIDNEQNAKKFLQAYIDNVKSLGGNARPFSLKNIEKEFVDVILNNGWIKEEKQKAVGIYEPNDSDVVYKDDDIWIMKGDTKAKCVLYGQGQSWCISRSDLNFYNTYRINNGATIYFCMQPNVQGDEHTFVILNYGDNQYGLADQTNKGKRSGGPEVAMSWYEIEHEIKNLRSKQEYFKYIAVTEEETNYSKLVSTLFHDDNLGEYILDQTKNLYVHGSKITPEDFIRDYVANGNYIEREQFSSLTQEMIESLIESGYDFTHTYEFLSQKQKSRVIALKVKNNRSLTYDEWYYCSPEQKFTYIEHRLKNNIPLYDWELEDATQDQRNSSINIKLNKGHELTFNEYENFSSQSQKERHVEIKIKQRYTRLAVYEFDKATPEQKNVYLNQRIEDGSALHEWELDYLTPDEKRQYIENRITMQYDLDSNELLSATEDQVNKYINGLLFRKELMSELEFSYATDEQRQQFINYEYPNPNDNDFMPWEKEWLDKRNLRESVQKVIKEIFSSNFTLHI